MVTDFVEGETYRNKSMDKDIMVFAIGKKTADDVTLAVGYVDRESYEMTNNGELTVKNSDLKDWEEVELD